VLDTFVVTASYDPATGKLGPLPAEYAPGSSGSSKGGAEPMDTDEPTGERLQG
jgi:hypothetical protein